MKYFAHISHIHICLCLLRASATRRYSFPRSLEIPWRLAPSAHSSLVTSYRTSSPSLPKARLALASIRTLITPTTRSLESRGTCKPIPWAWKHRSTAPAPRATELARNTSTSVVQWCRSAHTVPLAPQAKLPVALARSSSSHRPPTNPTALPASRARSRIGLRVGLGSPGDD